MNLTDAPLSPERSLLRLGTAGSVDAGKSTLIGRLLADTKTVFEDQLDAVARSSAGKGLPEPDLALLMDGLKAEREQGITIDVAYRYFATARRKFIIADSPGNEQYTRNMVTGASMCDLMIVLVDAALGVLAQTKRHSFLASLLQVPHLVFAVNKMDDVGFSREVYQRIVRDISEFVTKLNVHDVTFIPLCALSGENLISRGANMPWFTGRPLLEHLEEVHVASDRNLVDLRFPVQLVLRPSSRFRGYAGTVASGVIRKGDEVVVLPGGLGTRVTGITTFDGELEYAFAGQSVTLTLADEIDISRGDMLVRPRNMPEVANDFEAILCWMDRQGSEPRKKYLLKHTSQLTRAMISNLHYRIDVNTLHRQQTISLGTNDIGRARIKTLKPLAIDPYAANRATGGFILVDPITCTTAAAGMIIGPERVLDFERIHKMQEDSRREFEE